MPMIVLLGLSSDLLLNDALLFCPVSSGSHTDKVWPCSLLLSMDYRIPCRL